MTHRGYVHKVMSRFIFGKFLSRIMQWALSAYVFSLLPIRDLLEIAKSVIKVYIYVFEIKILHNCEIVLFYQWLR